MRRHLVRGTAQRLELFCGLFADPQPFTIRYPLVVQFLAARLYNEVLLGQGDLRLAGVAIHRNEVTGEAGEVEVIQLALAARAKLNHFAGAGKMVVRFVPRLFASLLCPLDRLLEASPLVIAQQRLQLSRAPVFSAVLVHLFQCFKVRVRCVGQFVHRLAHYSVKAAFTR